MPDQTYSEAEIAERLVRDLPSWEFVGGHIRRTFRTAGWKASMMAANAVGHLAEVAWHHPDLKVSFSAVEVVLQTHDAGGITDKDFALAIKIDEFLLWRPAAEGGALDGIPAGEPRFAYLRDAP